MNTNELKIKMDQVMASTVGVKTEVETRNNKAGEAFQAKTDLYLSDLREKKKLIEKKRAELDVELDTLIACEKSMKEMYSDVIAANDKEETIRLEAEMRNIITDITFCKSKINLLEQQKIKGEKTLYDDTCKAYKKYLQTSEMGRTTLKEVEDLIKNALNQLEDIKKSIQNVYITNHEDKMIKIYELMNGPITQRVPGYYPDFQIKQRFIREFIDNLE